MKLYLKVKHLSNEVMSSILPDCAKPLLMILVSFYLSDTYNKSSLILAASLHYIFL